MNVSKYRMLPLTILLFIYSCSSVKTINPEPQKNVYELPNDLSKIEDEDLDAIIPMLEDARIIGVSEGTHGMIEPFYFRNALIKFLVKKKIISVVAIESGLIESRIAYDYVNGKNISLDSALNNGILCTFETFRPNRELLEWLHEYNLTKPDSEKVHFYGFDIPGCAPNPVLENAMSGFNNVLNYLSRVDLEKSKEFRARLKDIEPLLRVKDNAEDSLKHFQDIDSSGWESLNEILNDLDLNFETRSTEYKKRSSEEDFAWSLQALVGARQNVDYLRLLGNADFNFILREREMANNINWIMEREKNENLLLFAHLAHLTKEIHMLEPNKMVSPMCGEYLNERFGDDYKVIGNFYRKLDWFDDDPIILKEGTMAFEFHKYELQNFYMNLDKTNSVWNKEWNFAKPSSGGKLYMIPAKAVDIIFYNDIQTWIDADQNK
jgi:erythromycin esterase-like protein